MATTEYSRLLVKRATQTGVVPTVPTGTTIDNTWLATDLMVGELFLNTADDLMWVRTTNGLTEIALSGFSAANYYTESAYILSGNTIAFDRFDGSGTTTAAYAVDLTPLLSGSSSNDYVTSGTYSGGTLTLTRSDAVDVVVTGFTGGGVTGIPCDLSFAISDETTQLVAGTNKLTFYAPYDMTITDVYASLSVSGTGVTEYDINNNGTSILTRVISIDANEYHSSNALIPPIISTSTVSQFDKITIDIDTVGGTGQAGAKIYLIGTRT